MAVTNLTSEIQPLDSCTAPVCVWLHTRRQTVIKSTLLLCFLADSTAQVAFFTIRKCIWLPGVLF